MHAIKRCFFYVSFAFAMALVLHSCTTGSSLSSSNNKYPYDWEAKLIHPDFMVYHEDADSSLFYFRLASEELLYIRNKPDQPFQSKLLITIDVEALNGNTYYRDSIAFTYTSSSADKESQQLIGKHKIKLPEGSNYLMRVTVKDQHRGTSAENYVSTNKRELIHRDNFLILDENTLAPLFGNSIEAGQSYLMSSDRVTAERLNLASMAKELPLPPPPDAYQKPKLAFNPDKNGELVAAMDIWSLALDSGMHVITHPDIQGTMTLFGRVRDFPEVRELETLTTSIRYICSRNEYRKINESNYPKKELDDFWIETAGSKDKARELIRIYYKRVREANIYFSSVTDGWRTDKGLIHVVFGNPNKVIKESNAELWIYGEENNLNSLTFRFLKQPSPYTDNLFILERSPMYKPGWDRAVSSWRNGRIFSEQ